MKKKGFRSIIILIIAALILLPISCKKKTLNIDPGSVSLISPLNSSTDIALDITLEWQATNDSDGDAVTYDVYFGTEATPVTIVSQDQSDTSFSPSVTANTSYYWKVVAKDGNGGSSESAIWSFSSLNNGPGTASLTSPTDNSSSITLDASLSWQAVTDPDGDEISYDIYFGEDEMQLTVVSPDQLTTTYSPTLSAHTTYYWKVVAKDGNNGNSESEVWGFTTLNNDPGTTSLTAPDNLLEDMELSTTLTWESVTDPDGDAVSYDVYFGTNYGPLEKVSSDQTALSYTPALAKNTIYYWKVVAKDAFGGTSESELRHFTTLYDTFTDARDSKSYKIVTLGTQTWMAENMAYEIPGKEMLADALWNNTTYDGWAYYHNDKVTNGKYGILYQWEAAKVACPTGWHLAESSDYTTLFSYLTDNGYGYEGSGDDVAKSLAETSGWNTTSSLGRVGNDQGSNNQSGFSATPGGYRVRTGFYNIGEAADIWVDTEESVDRAYYISVPYAFAKPISGHNYKKTGFSVRCIED